MFELTILFSALAAGGRHACAQRTAAPSITRFSTADNFARASDDAFFLHIALDGQSSSTRTKPRAS